MIAMKHAYVETSKEKRMMPGREGEPPHAHVHNRSKTPAKPGKG